MLYVDSVFLGCEIDKDFYWSLVLYVTSPTAVLTSSPQNFFRHLAEKRFRLYDLGCVRFFTTILIILLGFALSSDIPGLIDHVSNKSLIHSGHF